MEERSELEVDRTKGGGARGKRGQKRRFFQGETQIQHPIRRARFARAGAQRAYLTTSNSP